MIAVIISESSCEDGMQYVSASIFDPCVEVRRVREKEGDVLFTSPFVRTRFRVIPDKEWLV